MELFDPNDETGFRNQPPRFHDQQGPIGMFCFFDMEKGYNVHGVPLIQDCIDLFHDFCQITLPQHLGVAHNETEINIQPFIVESKVPHISVAIFQENERLLPPSESNNPKEWAHVTPYQTEQLVQNLLPRLYNDGIETVKNNSKSIGGTLDDHHNLNEELNPPDIIESSYPSTILELDSILWTADGALIAGFIDKGNAKENNNNDEGNTFIALRHDLITYAKTVLTDLTSRPKNLIHVTLGRILALPAPKLATNKDANDNKKSILQQEEHRPRTDVSRLIHEYNTKIWPEKVRELRQKHGCGRFPLTHVTLHQNTVWLCEEGSYLATWKLNDSN